MRFVFVCVCFWEMYHDYQETGKGREVMCSRNLLAHGEKSASQCWWNCPVTDSKASGFSLHLKMKSVLSLTLLSHHLHLPFFPIFLMDRILLCFPSNQLMKITTTEAELADIREMHERQLMYLHKSRPWSRRDARIKVRERFQCRKFKCVCVSVFGRLRPWNLLRHHGRVQT